MRRDDLPRSEREANAAMADAAETRPPDYGTRPGPAEGHRLDDTSLARLLWLRVCDCLHGAALIGVGTVAIVGAAELVLHAGAALSGAEPAPAASAASGVQRTGMQRVPMECARPTRGVMT